MVSPPNKLLSGYSSYYEWIDLALGRETPLGQYVLLMAEDFNYRFRSYSMAVHDFSYALKRGYVDTTGNITSLGYQQLRKKYKIGVKYGKW